MMNKVTFKTILVNNKRGNLPDPSLLNCKAYWYISMIDIPKKLRGKGLATKILTKFCRKRKRPIYVSLNNQKSADLNGCVLENLFKRLKFKEYGERLEIDDCTVINMVRS